MSPISLALLPIIAEAQSVATLASLFSGTSVFVEIASSACLISSQLVVFSLPLRPKAYLLQLDQNMCNKQILQDAAYLANLLTSLKPN